MRHAHCTFCGAAFDADVGWPRTCGACGKISYKNPLPVAVCLVPIDDGLLTVRRGIEPHVGELALPGGFIDVGESWQAACAREVAEETGLEIDPAGVREFRVRSAPDDTILIFGLARALEAAALPPFDLDHETEEVVIIDAACELAFPIHTEVVAEFFEGER